MPRGKISLLQDQLDELLFGGDKRFVDMGAMLRVYRCTCGIPHVEWPVGKDHSEHFAAPAELVLGKDGKPRVWGGMYDPLAREYVGPSINPIELKCHEGQVQVLTLQGDDAYGRPLDSPEVLSILALGSPGAGKTYVDVLGAVLDMLDRPNSTGALIAAINKDRDILYDTWEELGLPEHWYKPIRRSKAIIQTANNVKIHVRAAKAQSVNQGSPIRGLSLDWARCDETQSYEDQSRKEIAARGRRAGNKYRVFEAATNGPNRAFKVELEKIKTNRRKRLVRFSGYTNPFVEPEFWQKQRDTMSEAEFREIFLAEEVPSSRRVYDRFEMAKNVAPKGIVPDWVDDITKRKWGRLTDVTEELLFNAYHRADGWNKILATDFGTLVNVCIGLKAYRTQSGEILWWAVDELTTAGHTDMHAYKMVQHYDVDTCVAIADPHFNTKESDKSDYNIVKAAGFNIFPATHGMITKKSRISMMNALLDSHGVRRLFVDCDKNGYATCPRLVQSLLTAETNDLGLAEMDRKNGLNDPSHWPSALAFGLHHWEKNMGYSPSKAAPSQAKTSWWLQGSA